jgi:hypothetical protein
MTLEVKLVRTCFECQEFKVIAIQDECPDCGSPICEECQAENKHHHEMHMDAGDLSLCGVEPTYVTDNPDRVSCLQCRAKLESSEYKQSHEMNTND